MRNVRDIAMGIVALVRLAGAEPVLAGPAEDGYVAYRNGDYAKALQVWRPYA